MVPAAYLVKLDARTMFGFQGSRRRDIAFRIFVIRVARGRPVGQARSVEKTSYPVGLRLRSTYFFEFRGQRRETGIKFCLRVHAEYDR